MAIRTIAVTAAIWPARPLGGAAVNMGNIPLADAREMVRVSLFGSKCANPTQEQWDLVLRLRHRGLEPELRPRLERALLVRAMLDSQLHDADRWLVANGFRSAVINQDNLEAALAEQFPQAPDVGRMGNAEVQRQLRQIITSNADISQQAAIKALTSTGKQYDRQKAREIFKDIAGAQGRAVRRGRPRAK
jgi:hypothetical protein